MTSLVRLLPVLLLTVGLFAPAAASAAPGDGTGLPQKRRPDKPLTPNTDCSANPFNVDGVDGLILDQVAAHGLVVIQLTEDPTKWSWEALQRFASRDYQSSLEGFNVIAVYPDTPYTRYAREDLDHLREFLPVGIIDDATRRWLPAVQDEVHYAIFDYTGSYSAGRFDGISPSTKALDGFISATTSAIKKKKAAPKKSR